MTDYELIEAGSEWSDKYRIFCQKIYMDVYTNPQLGILPEHNSSEMFDLEGVRAYFNELFEVAQNNKAWIVLDKKQEIIGGVACEISDDFAEMKGFYVKPEFAGKGIGRALYNKVLKYVGKKSIQVTVVHYMYDTIAMYEKWGFKVNDSLGIVEYDRPGWSDQLRKSSYGVFLTKTSDFDNLNFGECS